MTEHEGIKLESDREQQIITDERIRAIVGLAVGRPNATLELDEFSELKTLLRDEHGVVGANLPRIVYKCAEDIKRAKSIKRSVD